jgi:lipopolysaccharide/colanic/teichoic acid biosynthesis glycosyltransferase
LDAVFALLALVVLSPVLLLAALLVRLTSPGPVFFSQERVGLNGRRFQMVKFRSMVAGAEELKAGLEHLNEAEGPVFKIRDDPRMTPVGRLLRRAHIDELPQLLNVLRGEMSLVGPRPLPTSEARECYEWNKRHSVRPGITGPWQVGGRHKLSFDEWMKLDLDYVDNWSLFLDLQIILKTVPEVVGFRGA